jgi:hypothetical protein
MPIAQEQFDVLVGRLEQQAARRPGLYKLTLLVEQFDAEWQSAVADWWHGRYEHVKTGRAKLAGFAARPQTDLTDEELYDYALLIEEFDDPMKAFELQKELVLARGATRGAKFAYVRMLLQRGDESAIAMLDEVTREVPALTLPACELIVGYLLGHGRQPQVKPYIDRFLARQLLEQKARAERQRLSVKDTWLPLRSTPRRSRP